MCIRDRVYTARFVRHISWPLLGGLRTAGTDETIQKYVSGRSAQLTDVWIDFSGVVAGMLISLVLLLIVRAVLAFHSIKKENRRLREERDRLRRSRDAHIRRTDALNDIREDDNDTPEEGEETI